MLRMLLLHTNVNVSLGAYCRGGVLALYAALNPVFVVKRKLLGSVVTPCNVRRGKFVLPDRKFITTASTPFELVLIIGTRIVKTNPLELNAGVVSRTLTIEGAS
jgi:hypothetical protein